MSMEMGKNEDGLTDEKEKNKYIGSGDKPGKDEWVYLLKRRQNCIPWSKTEEINDAKQRNRKMGRKEGRIEEDKQMRTLKNGTEKKEVRKYLIKMDESIF